MLFTSLHYFPPYIFKLFWPLQITILGPRVNTAVYTLTCHQSLYSTQLYMSTRPGSKWADWDGLMHPRGWNPRTNFAGLTVFIQHWTVGLWNGGQREDLFIPLGWEMQNREESLMPHDATMRSGYFSDSAPNLFIISSSRSLPNCNVSEFRAWQQFFF